MSNQRNWREKYISILLNGPNEDEYDLAAELIDEGFAKGPILRNSDSRHGEVLKVLWKGPTTAGREYLEDLQEKVRRRSWSYRIWSGLVLLATWAFGFASQVLIQWLGNP